MPRPILRTPSTLVHIAEIQRRQGKYEDALATIRKARKKDPNITRSRLQRRPAARRAGPLRRGCQLPTRRWWISPRFHANGAYTAEEKNNRGIFLERLGSIYHEQNKVDQAIATYQKMIDMGGDTALRGYQGQVDTYRDAKQFDKAIEVSRKAVDANPKESRPEADAGRRTGGSGQDRRRSGDGQRACSTTQTNDRTVWLALGQMDIRLRRWKDAEDCPRQGRSADHQEGRQDSTCSSCAASWPSGRSTMSRPSSFSARPSIWIPPTP